MKNPRRVGRGIIDYVWNYSWNRVRISFCSSLTPS